jgi:hypothetical protein
MLQVGGGPTGVELAAELHDLVTEDVTRLMPHLKVSRGYLGILGDLLQNALCTRTPPKITSRTPGPPRAASRAQVALQVMLALFGFGMVRLPTHKYAQQLSLWA